MRMALMAGTAASVLALSPAFADVEVEATVDLTKDVTVTETIDTDISVDLDVDVFSTPVKFAESVAIANQTIVDNEGCGNCAEKSDLIAGSVTGNVGLTSVNQAVGNFNNQGTLISAAVDVGVPNDPPPPPPPGTPPEDPDGGFAEAQAAADQRIGSSEALADDDGSFGDAEADGNILNTVNVLFRDAEIRNSFNANTGLTYGNQSAGNANNQLNMLSLAFSLADDGGVALSEADLGQVNANNFVGESASILNPDDEEEPEDLLAGVGITKAALIVDSINGNSGITGVNQSVGNFANQANIVSIAAVGSGLPTFAGASPATGGN